MAVVYGQMNDPLGARMTVGLTAITLAEYFLDVNEQDNIAYHPIYLMKEMLKECK